MFFLGRVKFLGDWSDKVIRWGDICMITVRDDQCERKKRVRGVTDWLFANFFARSAFAPMPGA